MKVITDKFPDETLDFSVQTIGFFDGVHQGHRHLIEQVKGEARKRGLKSMAITFREHPKKVLNPQNSPSLLTTLDEKLRLLEQTGLDYVVVLDFSREMAQMSAHDFMQKVLKDKLHGAALVIGYDHHFGKRADEGFADYQKFGDEMGINVVLATEFSEQGLEHVSSSTVRRALANGEMDLANSVLGYAYSLRGKVVHGQEIGHKIGFPTANIVLDNEDKLLPMDAAYAVKVTVRGKQYKGMLYIGKRPTIEGILEHRIEVNIIDFNEEIYGDEVLIEVEHFLRGEEHFDSLEALSAQLQRDLHNVSNMIKL